MNSTRFRRKNLISSRSLYCVENVLCTAYMASCILYI